MKQESLFAEIQVAIIYGNLPGNYLRLEPSLRAWRSQQGMTMSMMRRDIGGCFWGWEYLSYLEGERIRMQN